MFEGLVTAALVLATAVAPAPEPPEGQVLAISVDGLNVDAIRQLGPDGAPTFHRLLDQGAGTLNARTEYEQTVTLPNHTSMLTGRRITARRGGHGVTWDDDRPGTTVQRAAGHPVSSVFREVHAAGGDTALYSTKQKFALYKRSWQTRDRHLRGQARTSGGWWRSPGPTCATVPRRSRSSTSRSPTAPGTRTAASRRSTSPPSGAPTPSWARCCAPSPAPRCGRGLTADHGFGVGVRSHSARTDPDNYTIPFLVWGAGVDRGDLYALNPGRRDPENRRPSYAPRRQPIRNGDLANLAAGLLGLGRCPAAGSVRTIRWSWSADPATIVG